jgi:transposase
MRADQPTSPPAHQTTLAYVRRRTGDGKTKPEIIRCLKRFVAREIFG